MYQLVGLLSHLRVMLAVGGCEQTEEAVDDALKSGLPRVVLVYYEVVFLADYLPISCEVK